METLLLESLDKLDTTPENNREVLHVLIRALIDMNANIKEMTRETSKSALNCREEWRTRLKEVENHISGIGGQNGIKVRVKEIENKLERIEDEVQKWVIRISTALVIFNTMVLPLIIYVILHVLAPSKP